MELRLVYGIVLKSFFLRVLSYDLDPSSCSLYCSHCQFVSIWRGRYASICVNAGTSRLALPARLQPTQKSTPCSPSSIQLKHPIHSTPPFLVSFSFLFHPPPPVYHHGYACMNEARVANRGKTNNSPGHGLLGT